MALQSVTERIDVLRDLAAIDVAAQKVIAVYNRPLPHLRSLFCLVQRSFPLLAGVALGALLRKDSVSNFEVAMRCASVAGCVPGTIKLLHCGLADRAKERPGQRSILTNGSRLTASDFAPQGTSWVGAAWLGRGQQDGALPRVTILTASRMAVSGPNPPPPRTSPPTLSDS